MDKQAEKLIENKIIESFKILIENQFSQMSLEGSKDFSISTPLSIDNTIYELNVRQIISIKRLK